MVRILPYVYAAILVVELVALTVIYAIWFPAPSSALGMFLGIGGFACMVALLCYSFARRIKALRDILRLSAWLHFHIFLGVQGVMWACFHSLPLVSMPVVNWLNPGFINLLAVLVVFFSGIFGRYLYGFLPRTIGGEQMAAEQVDAEIAAMKDPFPAEVQALWKDAPAPTSFLALPSLMTADFATRRALAGLGHLGMKPELASLAHRRVVLERRKAALVAANRVFTLWIVLHRPIALGMYAITVLHIFLSLMFSAMTGR